MNKCVLCGKTAIIEHEIDGKIFCNGCYLKLHMPLWENKTYNSADDLKNQGKKVVELIKKGDYSQDGINQVLSIFDNKLNNGFKKSFDGGLGQVIELYDRYLTIITKSSFSEESMSEDYARILKKIKPQPNKTKEALKTFASKGLIRGGISVAANYAIDQEYPDKEGFTFYEGPHDIPYESIDSVDILPSSNETNTRIMSFVLNYGEEILFFYSSMKSKKIASYKSDITQYIRENSFNKSSNNQGVLQSSIQPVPMQSPLHQGAMQNPIQPGPMQSPLHQGQIISPIQPGEMQSPIQEGQIQNPIEQGPIQSPIQQSQSPDLMYNYNQLTEKVNDDIDNNIEMIRKYKALLDDGIISEEEFNQKKKELLGL